MFAFILFCLILSVYTVWTYLLRRRYSQDQPPLFGGLLPFIGHAHLLIGDRTHLYHILRDSSYECTKKGGGLRMYLGSQLHYFITDPEDSLTAANACVQKHYGYEFAKPYFGDGLITASGEIWHRHRKLLNPAFNVQLLYKFLGVFNSQARILVQEVSSKTDGPFDISTDIRNLHFRSIYTTAFGISDEDDESFYREYMKTIDDILNIAVHRFQRIWLYNNFLYKLSGWKKKEDEFIKILNKMSDLIIEKKRATLKVNNETTSEMSGNTGFKLKPLLDILLQLSDDDMLTDREIREEINTIIVAGFNTSSWVIVYILILLGSYPEIQDRVYEEMQKVFGDSDRDVNKEDLAKLVYTEAVLMETIRLYPVVPILGRNVDQNVELKNYTMRAGSSVALSIYGLHRHPVWGPDAEEFKPERWLDPAKLPNKNVFGGFSFGKRSCIGKTYALFSMKTTLVHLLRHYRVEADVTKLVCEIDFICKPVSGHYVTLYNRDSDCISS